MSEDVASIKHLLVQLALSTVLSGKDGREDASRASLYGCGFHLNTLIY